MNIKASSNRLALAGARLTIGGAVLCAAFVGGPAHAEAPIRPAGVTTVQALALPTSGGSTDCTIPNNVVCQVSQANGVRRVVVKQGSLVLADKTFNCETPVTVSWDSAFRADAIDIEDCGHRLRLPVVSRN
jgi:hypothetical protein